MATRHWRAIGVHVAGAVIQGQVREVVSGSAMIFACVVPFSTFHGSSRATIKNIGSHDLA